MRQEILLCEGWTFFKTENSPAEAVSLPHTWNAIDGQDGGNDYYRGTCRYTRTLRRDELPALANGDGVWLQIDGAAYTAEVFLNGEKLARHEGGFRRSALILRRTCARRTHSPSRWTIPITIPSIRKRRILRFTAACTAR